MIEEISSISQDLRVIAQFLSSPGYFIGAWGKNLFGALVETSFVMGTFGSMFGLILKMMGFEEGLSVVHICLAGYVLIQIMGLILL